MENHSCFNIQEVAVKKMRSNKSKEFFAELKALCNIHHINIVSNICDEENFEIVLKILCLIIL